MNRRIARPVVALLLLGAAIAHAQLKAGEPTRAPLKLEWPLEDKNFDLLSVIERSPEVRAAVKADPVLARLAATRIAALDKAAGSCNLDLECYAAAFQWTDRQSSEAARALAALYRDSAAVRGWTDGPLRASGAYVRNNGLGGEEFLERAWTECVRGVNRIVDVYGLGKPLRWPAIDSMTYDPKSERYQGLIHSITAFLADDRESLDLFFQPSLRFALELMTLNHRDEAARYEPMEMGENAAAYARIRSIGWDRYPYSAIVVPGSGNDRPGVRLSPDGKLRDEIAARRFRQGKAPLLIVSGGFVHPNQTEFCEAIEMKRDLMTRFGIPAEAILVDPHARHTTTNMRNAARLMYRYGVPFDRKALVTTDLSQSQYIESDEFRGRCVKELGYSPYKSIRRTSPFDLEFLPLIDSLHIDSQDPLDP